MKWAILFGGLALAVGAGTLLRRFERLHPWIVGALGFLPFVALKRTSISVVFENYPRGDAMGLEVTLVDFFAIVALLAMPPRKFGFPYRLVVPLYLAAALFSITMAPRPDLAFYSFWKALRMVLLLVALAWAFEDPRRPPAWIKGASLGVLLMFVQAFQQRFIEKLDQAMGTFPHQNSMGMALNLIIPIVLAILLAGQGRLFAWLTVGLGAVGVVLSLSRGSLVMLVVALVLTYIVSAARKFTLKKNVIALGGLVATLILAAISLPSVVHRFETAPEESAVGRELYVHEASLMLEDHPLGIGLNQWSFVSSTMGYGRRVGLERQDVGGLAHHIYWLTLAELGYFGFVAFVLLLLAPFRWGGPCLLRDRHDIRGDVIGGALVGLAVMAAHGTLEWAWRQTQLGYVFWSVMALVWALSRQLRTTPPSRA